MRDVWNYIPTNSQLDSIKTAGGRNSGDGNFYIRSKERSYNFDNFLGDFHGVLQRNRNRDHLGAGGQHHTPPHSPNSSVQSTQNASPPTSSNSENNSDTDSDDPLALTDTEDPFRYLSHALTASAPSSYRKAKASGEWEHWKLAMDAELAKMQQYKVWEVVDRQPNMRVVGACWVYTRKINGNTGMPSSYRARWVAKDYSQLEGIDFNELSYTLRSPIKTPSESFSPWSTTSTSNATKSTSKRPSLTVILRRQYTCPHRKEVTSPPTSSCTSANLFTV
jgi:hypothetical protein